MPDEHIETVRRGVRQRTRDLIDLQLLTGARPDELVGLTTAMIDRAEDVWVGRPEDHKTAHMGLDRVLLFGPKSQPSYLNGRPNSPQGFRRASSRVDPNANRFSATPSSSQDRMNPFEQFLRLAGNCDHLELKPVPGPSGEGQPGIAAKSFDGQPLGKRLIAMDRIQLAVLP